MLLVMSGCGTPTRDVRFRGQSGHPRPRDLRSVAGLCPKADIGLGTGRSTCGEGFPYLPDYRVLLYYSAARDPGSWGIGCNSINYIPLLSGATAAWPFAAP